MTLDSNSAIAKYYRWFYATQKLPNNLCPYFWKLLIAVVCAPLAIIIYTFKKVAVLGIIMSWVLKVAMILWCSIIVLFYLYAHVQLILAVFDYYGYDSEAANIALVLDCTIAVIFAIGFTISHFSQKNYVAVEFVKAKYNRYCPQINWNSNPQQLTIK